MQVHCGRATLKSPRHGNEDRTAIWPLIDGQLNGRLKRRTGLYMYVCGNCARSSPRMGLKFVYAGLLMGMVDINALHG